MVASGVDAIVVFPDAGEAILPALRSAYEQGVVTVPYRVTPGGTAGEDYDMFVGTNFVDDGVLWGDWIVENLPDGGNVLMLSGPPGNSQGERRGRGTGVGARTDRPVHDDRRAAVLADQLGSGRDPTGPHRPDRRVPDRSTSSCPTSGRRSSGRFRSSRTADARSR